MSRGEALLKGGEGAPLLQLPDVEEAFYIIKYWQDCGTVTQGGMGISPLTWQEISAWRLENGMSLDHFEIDMIRHLSCEYVSEYHAASDKNREAPYSVTKDKVDMVAVVDRGKNFLRGFKEDKDEPRYIVEE